MPSKDSARSTIKCIAQPWIRRQALPDSRRRELAISDSAREDGLGLVFRHAIRKTKQELLFRWIGANEYQAIDTLNAIVAGQREYFDQTHDKGVTREYAQKILSDPDAQDGLYWKVAPGAPESPIGPLVAEASQEGYRAKSGETTPFHGLLFQDIDQAGASRVGGAKNYIVDGKMTDGFAVLAYPASIGRRG
jgi:hypothetical protein